MTAEEILGYGFGHAAIATGSTWRRDGVGYRHPHAIPIDPEMDLLTPDDLLTGARPAGDRVAIFDDDHYYLGGVLAELLVSEGFAVTIITPEPLVSAWTDRTLEQQRIQARLMDLGVEILTSHFVDEALNGGLRIDSVYTSRPHFLECDSTVFVTSRLPIDEVSVKQSQCLSRLPIDDLYLDMLARRTTWADAGLTSVRTVGDALSPGTIASAVWDGRRFAEELDRDGDERPFPRDMVVVG